MIRYDPRRSEFFSFRHRLAAFAVVCIAIAIVVFSVLSSLNASASPNGLWFHAITPGTEWIGKNGAHVRYDAGYVRNVIAKVYPSTWSPAHVGVHHYHIDLGYYITLYGGDEKIVPFPFSRSNPAVTKGLVLFQSFVIEEWQFVLDSQSGIVCWPTSAPQYMSFGCYWPSNQSNWRLFGFQQTGTGPSDWTMWLIDCGYAESQSQLPNIMNYESHIQ